MKSFFLWIVFFFSIPFYTFAANGSLYLSPNSSTYAVGDTFEVTVFANTDNASANAAEVDISFDRTALEVLAVSTAGSVLDLWSTEPTYSNERGVITFSGWANSSFRGPRNTLLTITVRALRDGTHRMGLVQGAVLANDGKGSNIVTELAQGTYTVEIPQVVVASGDGGFVLGAFTQSDDALPERPQFSEYPTDVFAGDRLILEGTASPKSRIDVWVTRDGYAPFKERVDVYDDGTFLFISKDRLLEGSYRVWAEPYSESGIAGPTSETIFFDALPSGSQALAATYVAFASNLQTWVGLLLVVIGFVLGFFVLQYAFERELL